MINKEMHECTQYRIPKLQNQFDEVKKEITNYIWLEKNWDSYDADVITLKRIKKTIKVLDNIYEWFEKNIGFLNNRLFRIDTTPISDGRIHIGIEYDCYSFNTYIKNNIELFFTPTYRHDINGQHTIEDRETGLIHSKDIMNKKFHSLGNIHKFLDEAFYKHKWKF